MKEKKNYYGSLTTMMYELLHNETPIEELNFYLSYAKKDDLILEPLCGTGRFLIPFLDLGYNIIGIDNSKEMLKELKEKSHQAKYILSDLNSYQTKEKFDYIFITSGSVSLFTDLSELKKILLKIYNLLKDNSRFVFAVDTTKNRQRDDNEYKEVVSVKTKEGYDLKLKTKNYYEKKTSTQFSPSIYELYDKDKLLKEEFMDFQTHLYNLGEMESILNEIGFKHIITYFSFDKEKAFNNDSEMFLFECRK